MDLYFDETIFTDGFSLRDYETLNVSNDADRFLALKLGKKVGTLCAETRLDSSVNINPRAPCRGINVYTLDASNKRLHRSVQYHQIGVVTASSSTPIYIGEHEEGNVYTVGKLNSFESAIMLKYFATHAPIFITTHLYNYVVRHFKDTRAWFRRDTDHSIVQNRRGELVYDREIINLPNLSFDGPLVDA